MESFIQVIVQAGSVGVAVFALYIMWQKDKTLNDTFSKIAEDHNAAIERNTDAWISNTEVLTQIKERIK